jgi:hypothetical protein
MMRLAKSIATVSVALTLALCLAAGAFAQASPAEKPAPRPVIKPAVSAAAKPAVKTAPKMTGRPMAPGSTAARPMKSPMAPKTAAVRPVHKIVPQASQPGVTASPDQAPATSPADAAVGKRDPFVSLVNDRKESGGPALPAGVPGLVVATVRVDGTVKSGNELIAVVSNPERHVFFVRQGDQLYDGSVEKIDLDGVTFHEESKDAFGKPVVRDVTKRIFASAGEQQ